MTDRTQTQRAEFDAMANLAEQYRRVTMTPIVDDDYPEVRHGYEGALAAMLDAMKDNDRFVKGNRYGLAPHRATLTDEFCEAFPTKESCVGAMAIAELRGKNLACWCPLGSPCHADVLLEIANAPDAQQESEGKA